MEATLPISAAAKPKATSKPQAQPLGASAPSSVLPLLFITSGVAALFLTAAWLVGNPDILATYHYGPTTIAVTHLIVLGWICSVVMGAVYQLVPVALETKLYSERLAKVQFAFHLAGFVGMVWGFEKWNLHQVAGFGALLSAGVVLFVFNIGRMLLRVPKWNVVAGSIGAAMVWVLMGVAAGLLIAFTKASAESDPAPRWTARILHFDPIGAMHAHAHLGALGLFIGLIVGVSYKLIPMFTLSEIQNPRRAALSVWLLNAGLGGAFVTILTGSPWKLFFSLLVTAAIVLYLVELRAILRARKRKTLDWGLKYFITAVSLLLPAGLIGIVLCWPGLPRNIYATQLENVYGILGLLGVVSFAILGMLYKIIPFLVWFGTYSPHVGRFRVPALAEMYSARLQSAGYWIFLIGVLTTAAASEFASQAGVRIGCVILVAALALFGINFVKMLHHFIRPQLQPLSK